MDRLDELEQIAVAALEDLRLEYERMAKPYVDQLVRIRNLRPVTHTIDRQTYADIQSAIKAQSDG